MSAKDYEVSFGYGVYDGYYYTAVKPHRGNDRDTPNGTPITIGDVVIGWTGDTGLVSGPHLHTQAGADEMCQKTIDPGPHEFQPGTVDVTGYASQWGNYVIIKADTGAYICYAHLSKINVQVGQKIGGDMPIPDTDNFYARYGQDLAMRLRGRHLTRDEFRIHLVGKSDLRAVEILSDDPEAQVAQHWQNVGRLAVQDQWDKQIYSYQDQLKAVQSALNEAKNKPPKEVVKEVEKIVEVVKEVNVPVYTHDEETKQNVNAILKLLKSVWGSVTSLHKKVK